ncbi:hypothetical protein A2V71_02515 [Candidatus Berkelbacteria bacterium RBG_13_40_8]|uniref:Purine nucleoside phosphorylase n=1 Tax=Candidatus Berkelbacteria bacterium RBG_13_40_8 TaxID=1797467 RepID=A0A1F5DN93_9BACT|nr:MAG: hypothetical protein A2V71_02515 [Candidatus Berkelbacteria bacterium RBG_13_40_8]
MAGEYNPHLLGGFFLLLRPLFCYNNNMEDRFFRFSNLSSFPEIVHGISSRNYGDMRFNKLPSQEVAKNRSIFLGDLDINLSDIVYPKLCHGAKIKVVGHNERGKGSVSPGNAIALTDGLITAEKEVYLLITGADCLPILIYDPLMQIIGAIHAGWRGILNQIIPNTIGKFKNLGSDPENLIVGIGPAICQKHFVVKNDVLENFMDLYPSVSLIRNNHGYVDLKKAALLDLKKAGVPKGNIELSLTCTACENGTYGSFRKEGEGAPAMAAVIGMRE